MIIIRHIDNPVMIGVICERFDVKVKDGIAAYAVYDDATHVGNCIYTIAGTLGTLDCADVGIMSNREIADLCLRTVTDRMMRAGVTHVDVYARFDASVCSAVGYKTEKGRTYLDITSSFSLSHCCH